MLRTPVRARQPVGADVQQGYRSFLLPAEGCLMADVIDPPPADRTGIDGASGQDAGRLQVGTFTRQCAGQVVVALAGELDVADAQARQAGGDLVLAAPGSLVLRVLDLTGLMTGVPVYSSVEEAARVASPQRAARPVPVPDAQVIVARLPTVRPGRRQEEGQRGPHQQPTVADTAPYSP